MTVYALLVGIDAYLPPVNALYGCRNDIAAFEQQLRARVPDGLQLRTLLDAEATREAVIDTFGEHLGKAGHGDVALFAYAGHGSEEPAPAEVAHLEPTGRIQTLLMYDSCRRIGGKLTRPLADKELAVLLADVAANGPHVVAILDCCHSGGGTRDPFARTRAWDPAEADAGDRDRELATDLAELATARHAAELLDGAVERWASTDVTHVALAACRSSEKALEHRVGESTRGIFSVAFAEALERLGAGTTYRSLLGTVRARVERTSTDQHPELFPLDRGGPAEGLFLDGTAQPVAATFSVTRGADGWEVDAGLVHGMRDAVGDEAFVLACLAADGSVVGRVRVERAGVERSSVVPLGWEPDDVAHPAVVTEVPLPTCEVRFDDEPTADGVTPDDLAAVNDAVRSALAVAGAGSVASPFVREAGAARATAAAPTELRVRVPQAGVARVTRADGGSAIVPDVPVSADDGGARLVVSRLEHVARWEQVRSLGDHPSPLAGVVRLDVSEARPGEQAKPDDRKPMPPDVGYRLAYTKAADGAWQPPYVFIDVTNTGEEPLWVAVLDLTDRYRCRALLPTDELAPGHTAAVHRGQAIDVRLPAGRAVEPGASARDWLKLIVSDVEFDASAFDLPALDEPAPIARSRGTGPLSTLDRLARRATTRDIGDEAPEPVAARWSATTVVVECRVPG